VNVDLIAFLLASIVLIIVPGVDFALVTRQTVSFGRRTALITAAGLLVGGLLHATFATIGLSAILLASAEAYTVVKLAGAAYLIWLGFQALRASARKRPEAPPEDAAKAPAKLGARRAFTIGMLSDLLNVKVAVFFVTFLPQFVQPGPGAVARTALLGLLFNLLASSWWVVYILLVGRLQRWLSRPAVRRSIDAATGTVFISVGAAVALER
jgi:threonine/homoserine/homoserine lactone efflux protein